MTYDYRALVNLDGWAREGPGGQHAPPLMHLMWSYFHKIKGSGNSPGHILDEEARLAC